MGGDIMDFFGFSAPSIDIPAVPATPVVTAEQVTEDVKTAKKDFYQKQALLSAKNALVKTSNLGVTGSPLQTQKKTLLGG